MAGWVAAPESFRRPIAFLLFLGLFLTFRGYRSREGDQAYRLPILLHQQDATRFADDPFVRSFDRFNPHRGSLALIDLASRPFGLTVALAALFVATFLTTSLGIDRLSRAVWPDLAPGVGLVAAALVVFSQAGNIGTNHLFEPILLDRLMACALGWLALSASVGDPVRGAVLSPVSVCLAGLIHPSVGVQLAMLLGGTWAIWACVSEVDRRIALGAIILLCLAAIPGCVLNLAGSGELLRGLPKEDFRLLSVELQSPQHMLPHLWRRPQWLAAGCYPLLALISLLSLCGERWARTVPAARKRLLILIGVNLAGLALAWFGIERMQNLRLTLFQPFRMAMIARGLCIVLLSGHLTRLWLRGGAVDRVRAVLVGVGLLGDWSLVVVTVFEAMMVAAELAGSRFPRLGLLGSPAAWVVLAGGFLFLSRHDTESGHMPLLAALVATLSLGSWLAGRSWLWTPRRVAFRAAIAWFVPLAALVANLVPQEAVGAGGQIHQALARRCRFAAVAIDDIERLALWCRENTPADAHFIGPPGPKTFRLWSLRSLAFNRAASPYNAQGLADWSRRFRDHVGLEGTDAELVQAYRRDRQALEGRYDQMSNADLAGLAKRQGADHVVARADRQCDRACDPLERLHSEGRFAVYRVRDMRIIAGRPAAARQPNGLEPRSRRQ
jgi:hypothetical protein